MAYYLVSGLRPFDGSNAIDVCSQHLNAQPVPPSARMSAPLSRDFEALILRCLEKSPGARPKSALELLSLLESCSDAGSWTQEDAVGWWRGRRLAEGKHAATEPTADMVRLHANGPRTITAAAEGR